VRCSQEIAIEADTPGRSPGVCQRQLNGQPQAGLRLATFEQPGHALRSDAAVIRRGPVLDISPTSMLPASHLHHRRRQRALHQPGLIVDAELFIGPVRHSHLLALARHLLQKSSLSPGQHGCTTSSQHE